MKIRFALLYGERAFQRACPPYMRSGKLFEKPETVRQYGCKQLYTERKMILKAVKAKHIFIFVLLRCLYFSGFAAILYPMVSNVYSLMTSKTTISDYQEVVEQMPEKEISDKFKLAAEYNSKLAKGEFDHELEKCLCQEDGLVCYVDIPSLKIYLPVYYGTSNEVLQKGCGCLPNTSLPVGGNSVHSVISGHTGLPTAEMFTKLDQVKKGEVFYIHVLDRVLAYKVDNIEAVSPDKTELLEIVRDKDYCTLLTCTPYGINDKRLLVRGERVPYTVKTDNEKTAVKTSADDSDDSDEALRQEITHQITVICGVFISAVIVYIFGLIWLLHSLKKLSGGNDEAPEDDNGTA